MKPISLIPIFVEHKSVAPNWNIILIIIVDFILFCTAIFIKGMDNKLLFLGFSTMFYLVISSILIKRTIIRSVIQERLDMVVPK